MASEAENKSFFRKYILDVRCAIVFGVCVIVLGLAGYYIFIHENRDSMDLNAHPHDEHNKTNETTLNETTTMSPMEKWVNNEEIKIFREYLQIPSMHPNIDYEPCIEFLVKQAAGLDLPVSTYYPVDEENPVLVMTWEGEMPELPSIMLNSHMDVVPVFPELWTHPPFAAEMDENGDIFARGAQDMKSNGMQYLAAIRALKREGVDRLKRTVHVVFVPDEEMFGHHGMEGFVKTEAFEMMNVGFMLDEGSVLPTDDESLNVYYGERTMFQTEFIFHGQSGHGSRLLSNTAAVKLSYVLAKMMELRQQEERKLNDLKYPYGNVTSINLTILKGGVQANIIPAEMSATFDIRLSVNEDLNEFKERLNHYCNEAGQNITINYFNKGEKEKLTAVDDSNPFWIAFKQAVDDFGLKVNPAILTGGSDSRFLRRMNIPALGFSYLVNTMPKLHDHNEYLNAETYLNGIEVYKKIIPSLASV